MDVEFNSEVDFRVKRCCSMEKMFALYCSSKGLCPDSVRFLFDGQRVNPAMSPADLDMRDGDPLYARMEAVGMWTRSSGRDDNEALTANISVTICVPGEKHVTVSIGEQQTLGEATALAAFQLQLQAVETQAAEADTTVADIRIRMKEVMGAGAKKRTRGDFA